MSCPACANTRPPSFVFQAHGSTLVRCRACALVRVQPFPSGEEALARYQSACVKDPERYKDSEHYKAPERGDVGYAADEQGLRAEFRRRLRAIAAAGGRGALFDVGCASGALLLEAREMGFHVSGLEPSATVARQAAERTGAPVRAGSIEHALLESGRYDVITLFDVLDHLVDPVSVLRKLRLGLVPGGLLAITVPDFGGWWARLLGPRWPFVAPREHVLYFTQRSLQTTLAGAGFEHATVARAQTPLSFGTLGAKVPFAEDMLRQRGVGLPMGTLYVLARAPSL
jgi:SAM-dependent methyltransferase